MKTKYLIIGAGPTGLGAAHRLKELGMDDCLVLEREEYAGGLSASFKDDNGFTWDVGGHVVFSHYDYFDDLLGSLLGDEYLEHERESWVRSCATWVPYPFQNNVRYLPREARWDCVEGLLPGNRETGEPANFGEWIDRIFGAGIARHFMRPYNFKVWATPPELMQFGWIGERVSVVDLKRVLKNIIMERDDVAWGPNNTFRFPLFGGTGEIFRRLARRLKGCIEYGQAVVSIDADAKTVTTDKGLVVEYEALLNTGPPGRPGHPLAGPQGRCLDRRGLRPDPQFDLRGGRGPRHSGPTRKERPLLDVFPGRRLPVLPGDQLPQLLAQQRGPARRAARLHVRDLALGTQARKD